MGRTKGPQAGKKHARRSGRSRRRFSLELEECERVSRRYEPAVRRFG